MKLSTKIFLLLLVSLSLIAFWGGSSPLMAGSSQSHATHFNSPKGPGLPLNESGCCVCHADGTLQCQSQPLFADMNFFVVTNVCDNCHSPGGAFDGVAMAKANWDSGIYESDGKSLRSGNEQWCASCHDILPANSKKDSSGIDAPKVIGDNSTYGFYATGHGTHGLVECLECHDAIKSHIDHEHRTYYAASNPNNYQAGYRLAKPMIVPRPNYGSPPYPLEHLDDFALCGDCHNLYEVLGTNEQDVSHTNFWEDDGSPRNGHYYHLKMTGANSDSDWDMIPAPFPVDSRSTCITCHNVHGAPNQAMIRHGELISTSGTIDKVPGLNFCYLTSLPPQEVCDTGAALQDSVGSKMTWDGGMVTENGICTTQGCHDGGRLTNRDPYLGPKVLTSKADPDPAPRDGATNIVLTAIVLDHNENVSSVTIDLTDIGGGSSTMYDNGDIENHGDEVGGDGIYSCKTTIPVTVADEEKSLLVKADDLDGPAGTNYLVMTVKDPAVVDNPEGTAIGSWPTSSYTSGYYGVDYQYHAPGDGSDNFTWTPIITITGTYEVWARWTSASNRALDATYTIHHDGGITDLVVDQTKNGGVWASFGSYFFDGIDDYVELSQSPNGYVIADAIKFERQP